MKLEHHMNPFDFLGPAAGAGATLGSVLGFAALAGAVGVKYWQDRDLLRPQMADRRDERREAHAQMKALGKKEAVLVGVAHVPKKMEGAGQFMNRKRTDGELNAH